MRVSSPALAAAFIDGALDQGADVVDFGMLGTDMLYYAVARDDLDGGAQITASHNPKQYNGMKLVRRQALPLSGDAGISDIRAMILGDRIPDRAARGRRTEARLLDDYVDHVLSFIRSGGDTAVQSRPGRRQRHGRARGAAAVRPAAVPDEPALLRHRRHVSPPSGEPAPRGEPARPGRARRGGRRRCRRRVGRRRGPLLLRRRRRRVHRRRLHHRAAGGSVLCARSPARPSSTTCARATR